MTLHIAKKNLKGRTLHDILYEWLMPRMAPTSGSEINFLRQAPTGD